MTRRALLLVLLAALAGCKGQSVEARGRFVEDGVGKDALEAWTGERIEIDNAGVTAAGGVAVSAGDTDRVHAVARMLAVADTYDKANADRAILSATESYQVATTAGVTTVRCGHGQTFASAAGADSGCDALDVSVPSGEEKKPLSVAARSGNGGVGVSLGDATLAELDVHASHGVIDVSVPTTKGASITLVSETGDDITLRLPEDFAADAIVLDGPPDKVDTSAFPGLGKSRGASGAGAKLISVRTVGRITVVAR